MMKSKQIDGLPWDFVGPESDYNYDINFLSKKVFLQLSEQAHIIKLQKINTMPHLLGFGHIKECRLYNISNINEILQQFSYTGIKQSITTLIISECTCDPKDAPLVFDRLF